MYYVHPCKLPALLQGQPLSRERRRQGQAGLEVEVR